MIIIMTIMILTIIVVAVVAAITIIEFDIIVIHFLFCFHTE